MLQNLEGSKAFMKKICFEKIIFQQQNLKFVKK